MSFWKEILAKAKQRNKSPFGKTPHVIKYAFTDQGVKYYEFDTTANLPWKRGLKFISIYNEMDMRVDRLYLTEMLKAMDEQFKKPRIGFEEMRVMKMLVDQTKERMNFIYQEDLVYKIASVVFMDANENPDDWEWKYALEKIERWKKSNVSDFFLHEPIQRLIPFLNSSALNIQTYSEQTKELDKLQLENIYKIVSGKEKPILPDYTHRYFSEEMKQK